MDDSRPVADPTRRAFLDVGARACMAGGLVAGCGSFAAVCARYLLPVDSPRRGWVFVGAVAGISPGSALEYRTPAGAPITIARTGAGGDAHDFVALSRTCPHLGCIVHWEAHRGRFFCPCHNGAFAPDGTATEGPPFDAGQDLARYPLRVQDGRLYIELVLDALPRATGRGA